MKEDLEMDKETVGADQFRMMGLVKLGIGQRIRWWGTVESMRIMVMTANCLRKGGIKIIFEYLH